MGEQKTVKILSDWTSGHQNETNNFKEQIITSINLFHSTHCSYLWEIHQIESPVNVVLLMNWYFESKQVRWKTILSAIWNMILMHIIKSRLTSYHSKQEYRTTLVANSNELPHDDYINTPDDLFQRLCRSLGRGDGVLIEDFEKYLLCVETIH